MVQQLKRRIIRRRPEEEDDDDDVAVMAEEPVRKSRRVVAAEDDEDEDDDLGPIEDDEDEEEESPRRVISKTKPKAAPKAAKKAPAKKVEPEVEEPEVEEPKTEAKPVASNGKVRIKSPNQAEADAVIAHFVDMVVGGTAVVVRRIDENTLVFEEYKAPAAGARRRGSKKAFQAQVLSPEYLEWRSTWREKSYEEKLAHAKKIKAKWDEHDNPQVNAMRMTEAVREKEGIEKYKEEYRDPAARKQLKNM